MEIVSGEKFFDAGVKGLAHTAIGIGSAKVGMLVGTALFGPAGTVAGTLFGAGLGFTIGTFCNVFFDAVYDEVRGYTVTQ